MSLPEGVAAGVVLGGGAWGTAPASDRHLWETGGRLAVTPGTGFATRGAEDFALIGEHGIGVARVTFDWSRVMPTAARPDPTAVEEIGHVLDAADAAGVAVWPCLHDGPLPGWFVDEGGFGDDRARVWWSRWVELVADLVGDRVAGWVPQAEPVWWAMDAYLRGVVPPGRRQPEAFAETLRGVLLAGRDAWRILRGGPPVATCHRVGPIHAAATTVPARQQARLADEVLWGSWVTGLRDGILRVPGLAEEEVADLAGSCDIVGVAFEGAMAVTADGSFVPYPGDRRVAETGWAPWPEGLGITLRRVADELPGRAVMVASDVVGTTDDEWRGDLLRETVDVLAGVAADGIDLRGWSYGSLVDGDRWAPTGLVPSGLFDRDRNAKSSVVALQTALG